MRSNTLWNIQIGDHRRPQTPMTKNQKILFSKESDNKPELGRILDNPASKTGKLFVDLVSSIKVNYDDEQKQETDILSLNSLMQIANSIPILSKSATEDIIYEGRNRMAFIL